MARIESAASHTAPGLGKVERALSNLVIAEVGLSPHLAHLGLAIGQLGIEGGIMVGVLAAAAAAGLAWNKWTEDTKELEKSFKDASDAAEHLITSEAAIAMLRAGAIAAEQSANEVKLRQERDLLHASTQGGPAAAQLVDQVATQAKINELVDANAQLEIKRLALLRLHDDALLAIIKKHGDEEVALDRITSGLRVQTGYYKEILGSAQQLEALLSKQALRFPGQTAGGVVHGLEEFQRPYYLGTRDSTDPKAMAAELDKYIAQVRTLWKNIDEQRAKEIAQTEREFAKLALEMQRDISRFFDNLFTSGIVSFSQLFDAVRTMFAKLISDMVAQQLMKKITAGEAGFSPGVAAAGPYVAGAVVAGGMIANYFQNAAESAKRIREEFSALARGLADFHQAAVGGSDLFSGIADQAQRLRDAAKKLRDETQDVLGVLADKRYADTMAKILADEILYAQRLVAEQNLKTQQANQDLQVRLLRAQGLNAEADALAMQLAQQRELTQAMKDNDEARKYGLTLIDIDTLKRVQAAETARRILDQQIADTQSQISAQTGIRDAFKQTTDALRAYSLQLRVGAGSPVQNLAEARKQFDDLVAKARAGDQDAARQLPQFGQQFLELSRQYNASGAGYQQDLKYVMDIVDTLGDKFSVEQQLAQQSVDLLQAILDELQKQTSGAGGTGGRRQIPEGGLHPYQPYGDVVPGLRPPGDITGASSAQTNALLYAGYKQQHDDLEELKVAVTTLAGAVRRSAEANALVVAP